MRLILSSIAAIAFLTLPTIVAAQSTSPNSDNSPSFELPRRTPRNPSRPAEPPAPPEEYEKKIEDIQNLVNSNKQVKTMCANYINDIEYQFYSNKLQIDIGNNSCAFTIIKEVIQPQLAEGKIRTYEYTGDREGVIVTF
ncbi:MAG: hypothetical protein N4J56_005808 [Chroococcidiopsis sp. SAG 2025]|uniref:hypothetical protein n=1 Tax=Chroococcidiopsis sp. SAG 2025 TaxID=171389 RepID=UPI0029373CAA|nr:hypothetical protein [Chroococcidiopsis sp. SAG 2025]MDV2996154.1 hypothetical protein [Chroococcidiopsis sp. SAG 2025]